MRPREISGVLWAAATAGHALQPPVLDTLMEVCICVNEHVYHCVSRVPV